MSRRSPTVAPASRQARTAERNGTAVTAGAPPIRLLLIGNHRLICQGIDSHLLNEPGIEVAGVVATAGAALMDDELVPPDVVLVLLPGPDGIEASRLVTTHWPGVAVIVLSVDSEAGQVLDALRAGATSYLTADCSVQLLCLAVHVCASGGMLFASQPVRAAFRRMGLLGADPAGRRRAVSSVSSAPSCMRLTARELEVLQLLAEGCSNKEIGLRLHLAVVTVKKYVQTVAGKLGVSDRTQAAVRGVREGLVR
jgi:DNA-binding NarL/FixJ family response regulator